MRIRGSRLSLLAVAPVLASGLLAGPPAGAVTAGACRSWNGSQPVNPSPNGLNQLESIAAVSACDVWAAGSTDPGNGSGEQAVIEHWTGGAWAVSQIPPLAGVSRIELSGVSASASGAWAVGDATDSGTGVARTLTLHWDGAHWARVASPNPDNLNDHLESVDVLSASDAWAVGSASGDTAPLALQWNGSQWVSRQFPSGGGHVKLIAVSAVSDSDVWALGQAGPAGPPVMYHWDGSHWIQKTLTVPPGGQLTGLTAVAGNDAWAAGFQGTSLQQTLVMHWDGSGWNPVPSPNPGNHDQDENELLGMASSAAGDVWAAGIYQQQGGPDHPFVLHWDGRSWAGAAVNAPGQGTGNFLYGVAVSGPGQVWTAGSDGSHMFAAPVPAVPDATGLVAGAAIATLTTYGLAGPAGPLGHTTNCPASSSGLVVATDPSAGQLVPFGTPVGLTVCDGPAMMTVPNVRTFDDASARSTITAAGLTVGTLTMTPDCTLSAGDVLSQSPLSGAQVAPGTPVNLTESTGMKADGKPCITE
jgi:PASTA domain-containing protein